MAEGPDAPPRTASATGQATDRWIERGSAVAVLVGVGLRAWQWLANPSLWLDELWLASNILPKGLLDLLFHGLDYGQTAPVGFLALEKAATLLFGDGESALRLVPAACSIGSLLAFRILVRELLPARGALVATTGFALNPLLISLAAVVKQYSTDVLVTVVLLLALRRLWHRRGSTRSRTLLAAGAGSLGFFSVPSVMVAGAALAAMAYVSWNERRVTTRGRAASEVLPLLAWGLTATVAALAAVGSLSPETRQYMTEYWANRGAFAPPLSEYPTWLFDYLGTSLLKGFLLLPYHGGSPSLPWLSTLTSFPWLVLPAAAAVVAFVRRNRVGWALAVGLPVVFAVVFARLGQYPLDARTSVFLLPLVLIGLGSLVPQRVRWLRTAVPIAGVLGFAAVLARRPPVYEVQRTREIVRELGDRREASEPIWAHPWAWPAWTYYGPRYGLAEGVHVNAELAMRVDLDAAAARPALLADLAAFAGEGTLWVLLTTTPPRDREVILCYLDLVGNETARVVLPGALPEQPVSIHRYDIATDPTWTRAAAMELALADGTFDGPEAPCQRRSPPRAAG